MNYFFLATALTVCEGNAINMNCPSGYAINVLKAVYGRMSSTVCTNYYIYNEYISCSYDETQSLSLFANGQQSVSLILTNSLIGKDPCEGIPKYAMIDYTCNLGKNIFLRRK